MKFYDNVCTYVFSKYVRIREINIREYISGVIFAKISSLEIYVLYGIIIIEKPLRKVHLRFHIMYIMCGACG